MPTVLELLGGGAAEAPAVDDSLGDFSGGLRRGMRSGGAAFNRVAATAAEAAGYDDFARQSIAAAQAADAANAADPAKVASYRDVIGAPDLGTGLRRAVDYGSNMLGESVPALGAMAAGGAVGGLRGAAAGMLPFSMGDVAARQEADPTAASESAGLRLGKQALFGGADAALNTIVPAGVASRVLGKAAGAAAKAPVSKILGQVGVDAATQGAAGAAGEAVKQVGVNPDKPLDMGQIAEVGVGGTALGAAMGGVGAAGTLARKAAGAPGRGVDAVVDAVGASKPVEAAMKAVESYDLGSISKGLQDVAASAKDKTGIFLGKVAAGDEHATVDPSTYVGKTPEEIQALQPEQESKRAATLTEMGKGLMARASEFTAEAQTKLREAMANPTDPRAQAVIAKVKVGSDAVADFASKAASAAQAFAADITAPKGVKKSEDYSGADKALMEHVLPILQEARPELFEVGLPRRAMQDAAGTIRMLLDHVNREGSTQLPDAKLAKAMALLGDRTTDVLLAAQKALHSDKATSEALYRVLNRIDEVQGRDKGLKDTLNKSLVEANTLNQDQLDQHVALLRAYAGRSARAERGAAPGDKEADLFHDRRINQLLDEHYGKNKDAVLKAVEKDRKAAEKYRNQFDDGTETVDGADRKLSDEVLAEDKDPTERKAVEATPDPVYRGVAGKDEVMLPSPEKAVGKGEHASATEQAMEKMRREYPDRNVTFLRASEIGDHPAKDRTRNHLEMKAAEEHPEMSQADRSKLVDAQMKDHGFVVAEGTRQETAMTDKDLPRVRLKRPEGSSADYKHAARVDVGGEVLDAIKLSKWAEARNKTVDDYSNADNKSKLHRAARMFMEGLAAAADRIGKPMKAVPDATQIGWHADGKTPLTWGEVKGLDYSPEKSKAVKALEAKLAAMREEYKTADKFERAKIVKDVQDLIKYQHDSELASGDALPRDAAARPPKGEKYDPFAADSGKTVRARPQPGGMEPVDPKLSVVVGPDGFARTRGKEAYDNRYDAEGRLTDEGARILMQGDVDGGIELGEKARRKQALDDGSTDETTMYSSAAITREYLWDRGRERADKEARKEAGDGRSEVDPFGPTHDVMRGREEVPGAEIRTNLSGNPRDVEAHQSKPALDPSKPAEGSLKAKMSPETKALLIDKVEAMQRNYNTPIGQNVAKRALALMDMVDKLPASAHRALVSLLAKGTKLSDVAAVVNRLMPEQVEPKPVERRTPEAADKAKRDATLDKMLEKEDYSVLTTPGKTNAFLKRAYERYGEVMAMGDAKWEHPAFHTLSSMFDPGNNRMDLASLYEDFDGTMGGGMTDVEIRAKLQAAAPEVAAKLPKAAADRQAAVRAGPAAEAALDQANYSSMTKKFSKMGLQIHTELGRDGFAATHDSPTRHEGSFDWRAHAGKGEGNASFGAGTYLSTSEGTHRSYKGQFTAKVSSETSRHPAVKAAREALDNASNDVIFLMQERDELGPWRAVVGRAEHFASKAEAQAALDRWTAERRAKIADYAAKLREMDSPGGPKYNRSAILDNIAYLEGKLRDDAGNKPVSLQDEIDAATERGREAQAYYDEVKSKYAGAGYRGDKSPTYEVSVSIGEDSLLDWNKPLSGQHPKVQEKLRAAGVDSAPTGEQAYRLLQKKLGSQRAASEALQAAGILGNVHDAQFGNEKQFRNYVIYDDSKITTNYVHFDKTNSNPSASPRTAQQDAALNAYLDKVLGPTIARDLNANIPHAGEFVKAGTQHLINISRFAMDPWGTGHHEALHSFFARLREQAPTSEAARVLERAATSAPVLNQLKKLLKDHPEALKQLSDPEEAAAYMYQFWAAKKLTVGTQTHTIFSRIAAAVRRVLGIWSNDERALHILDYFHRGDFAVDRGQPDVVAQKLLLEHRNILVDQAAKLTKPLRELSSSVAVAGGQQLRDSGIPALAQLADVIKLHGTSEGKDPGYMPAARAEHTRVMNEVMDKLAPFTAAQMREALDAMQQGVKAASKEARQIQLLVQNPKVGLLPKMREYMGNAGVDVSQFGPDPTYFHRVWDTGFIAAHEKEFMAMLGKYQISGDLKGDPRVILQNLMATDGLEFRVETNMPGMQALKMRKLGFITGADAEPFLRKDLLENLNSYVQQATRRAEWARRLGDQGEGLQDLLTKAAKQGATPEQLAIAQRYVKSIDGTLGDTIDPKYRRLFGNMMVYQNIRLLPLAIFSSLPDSLGIMVRGGTVAESGRAFLRGMKEIRKNFQKEGGKNDAATDLAELIGTIDSAQLMHTIGTSYSQGMVGNTGRRVNDLFFRFNFMDQYNRSMRVAATEAAISFIKRHADGKANKHSERWLAEIGLEAGAVKLDAEGRPDVTDPDVRMAINRWVDGAVLRPDAADAPPWMADPRAALIAHLKKFTFSFQETILKRVAHEYRHGNYAPAMALSTYVPMMLAADMAKGIIQGGGEEPDWKEGWDVGDYMGHAVQRAGLFGVGQFAVDAHTGTQRGGTGVGALAGPTLNQLWEGVETLGGQHKPETLILHSMPANALYSGFARGGSADTGMDRAD